MYNDNHRTCSLSNVLSTVLSRLAVGVRVDGEDETQLELEFELDPCPLDG